MRDNGPHQSWFQEESAGDYADRLAKDPSAKRIRISAIEAETLIQVISSWIEEIKDAGIEEDYEEDMIKAWDDVHGGELPFKLVMEARGEEVGYMQDRGIWEVVPVTRCWKVTGKGPVSVRWVDTNKGGLTEMLVRSRLVARDFKGGDKGRDDLFAETPPLEAKRMLLSRAATRTKSGRFRKLLFIDARKAHLNPKCEEEVFIELPEECHAPEGSCGRLNFWLYGFRPAAAAWEKHYAALLEGVGFERGLSCGVSFYHPERDLSLAVHGDDFTFCGLEEDLWWIQERMASWFEIKVRATLGMDPEDDKEVVILGRVARWAPRGIEYMRPIPSIGD